MSACPNCRQTAEPARCTQCDMCAAFVHFACVGLTETDTRITRTKSKNIKIICNPCNNNFAQFRELRQMFNEMKMEFASRLDDLAGRLSTAAPADPASFEELAAETAERISRSQNVIMFGIDESQGSTDARTEHDTRTAARVIAAVVDTAVSPVRVARLGRPGARPRPLKVCLMDGSAAKNILRQKNKLRGTEFGSVTIRDDKTPRQLEYLNHLRSELKSRQDSGEEDITIKYVKGIPKIISSTAKNHHHDSLAGASHTQTLRR